VVAFNGRHAIKQRGGKASPFNDYTLRVVGRDRQPRGPLLRRLHAEAPGDLTDGEAVSFAIRLQVGVRGYPYIHRSHVRLRLLGAGAVRSRQPREPPREERRQRPRTRHMRDSWRCGTLDPRLTRSATHCRTGGICQRDAALERASPKDSHRCVSPAFARDGSKSGSKL